MKFLILPGLYNSGPEHWQSLWENSLVNAVRVQQLNWDAPERDAWVHALSSAVNASKEPQILVAHSLGCALTVWWAAMGMPGVEDKRRVKAAMLVAPPDVNRPEFPAPSFSPMPTGSLPFPSIVVASENDSWCELSVSEGWAKSWGAKFHQIGAKGHINGESGLGAWEQGQDWLATLSHRF